MLGAGLECRRKVRLRLAVGLVGQAIMPGHGLLTLKHVGHRRLGWAGPAFAGGSLQLTERFSYCLVSSPP